eukprot:4169449-Prymnesium_polylepis.1
MPVGGESTPGPALSQAPALLPLPWLDAGDSLSVMGGSDGYRPWTEREMLPSRCSSRGTSPDIAFLAFSMDCSRNVGTAKSSCSEPK